MSIRTYFFLFFTVLIAGSLSAGVKVITKSKSLGCNEYTVDGQVTMYLRADIMRMDLVDAENNFGIIYQKSSQRMWVLHHKEKKYETITKEDLDKVHSKLREMRDQMEEQMANLTDEQREQMKEVMKQNKSAMYQDKPEIHYEKGDEEQIINSWKCDNYEYFEGEELKGIYWIASTDDINASEKDLQIVRDFSTFIEVQFEMFSLGASTAAFTPEQDFDGFPIKSVMMEKGKECMVSTVESIQEVPMDNSLFQIPPDYRKAENPLKSQ